MYELRRSDKTMTHKFTKNISYITRYKLAFRYHLIYSHMQTNSYRHN